MLNSSDPQAGAAGAAPTGWLGSRQIALSLTAGAVAGLLDLAVLVSLAALIFSGQLAGFVSNGIGLLLVGTCLLNIVLALLSSHPAMVGTVQDAPAVVVALIAASIAAAVPAGTGRDALYATVVAAIVLTTLATGATFLLLGQFRLGALVRYLPYPVLGGFLAGTGWLLALGGVSIMAEGAPHLGELRRLLQPPVLWQWLPGLIFGCQLSAIGAAVTISVISLLLNVSGLQLARREDIDLNKELRAAGGAQLAAGLIGSPPGFQSLSLSMLGHHMGAHTRLVGIAAGLVSGAAFFFGAQMLSLVPRVVLGGMVCYLGLAFLAEWLYDAWFRLSHLDYALIVLILVLIAVFGILPGVIAGLLIAVVLFVVIYSRIDVVKHVLTGATVKSRMTRGYAEQELLRGLGEQIAIFQLQGFIFFGTAHDLFERVRQRTLAADLPRLRFVLLDFRLVPRLDSTAMLSFSKLRQLGESDGLTLVFTQLAPGIRRQFEQALFYEEGARGVRIFPNLDRGLEWCENELLASATPSGDGARTLYAQLAQIVPEATNLDSLLAYFEQRMIAPGDYLIHQDDPPDDMFFVESGQVTARIEPKEDAPVRLETMRGGRAVGELGFYLGRRRTAAVVADETSSVYRITRGDLRRLEHENPDAASTFHLIIARLLSERAVHLIDTVDALQR